MTATLRIIIPAYNESLRIGSVVRNYCAHFASSARIMVVCDGCTDETPKLVHQATTEFPNLEYLDIPRRIGKGGAIRAGLTFGEEPFVGFVDADASTAPAEYERLFQRLRAGDAAGVIGARWLPESTIGTPQPLVRRVASRVFNGLVRLLLRLPYSDTQCGAKVFRRAAIARVLDQLEMADFSFDIDLLARLWEAGERVEEMPVTWSDTAFASKIKLVPTAFRMFGALLRVSFRHTALGRLPFFNRLARSSIMQSAQLDDVSRGAHRWSNN